MLRYLTPYKKSGKFIALCTVFLLLTNTVSFSQSQNKQWFFGLGAALDFMTSPPTILLNSAMTPSTSFNEGTASIADPVGNLLFYTDGITIWNKSHQVMANGTGLLGDFSTTQSALIVKQPGSYNIYIVFTLADTGTPDGLRYSVVDMNLAAGMGSVTVKNILLSTPSTEKLTGTKHCNGIDTWVVSHDANSNVFRSLLVTSSGVNGTATLSTAGAVIYGGPGTLGQMKISTNGKKLGAAVWNPTYPSYYELYDFDNATGIVSNQLVLPIPTVYNVPLAPAPYGCEFSPDGTKFYGSTYPTSKLYQWDLCAGSPTAIVNSQYTIAASFTEQMQLSTDGKIYVSRTNKQMLGAIQNPNAAGAACNYIDLAQSVSPRACSYGLPNFIVETVHAPFVYTINPALGCNTVTFTAPPAPTLSLTSCSSNGYSIIDFAWYFGDPASGAANTSTLNNPSHIYPGQGTYTASLVYRYNNSCGGINADTLKHEIKVGALTLTNTTGFFLCSGKSFTLTATGAQTYTWSTGASTSSISVSPTTTTTYTVYGTDINACPYKSVQTINVFNTPTLSVSGTTVICPGFQAILKASGAASYSWSTGSVNSQLVVIPPSNTTYTVFSNLNGCVSEKTISVILKRPDVFINGSTTLCPGSSVTLTASGTQDYVWSTGVNTATVVLTPTAVSTAYTVQGMDSKSCTNTETVLITLVTQPATTEFNYSSPVCEKGNNLSPSLTVGFTPGGNYYSQSLAIDPATGLIDMSTASPGTHEVNYFFSANGCFSSGSSLDTVVILPAPLLNLAPHLDLSPGSSTTLSVSGGISYTWSPGDYLSCSTCDNPVASPPQDIEYCVLSDNGGCPAKACITISVTCETDNDYSVPNAFSPNGDGNNDKFCLQGWSGCLAEFSVLIFNRWGEKVFESADAGFCWDGLYKNIPLDPDVFVYVIRAKKTSRTEPITKKGNITLLR